VLVAEFIAHRLIDICFLRTAKSCLRFADVEFTVKTKEGSKTIPQGLNATIKSGDVLAVLGPSGAGKTTLMNCLTLQSFGGKGAGTVELNGSPLSLSTFMEHCAVVTQQDFHWAFLTSREVLTYALDMYGSTEVSKRKAKVEEIITEMGLSDCADTKVGNMFMRGLSGGQKRRLSIGVALIKSPTVMFMGEPTSGLDAAAAASIMKFIKELATKANIVTICTIHQPSAAVFDGFDQVMLLSKGRCVYRGAAGDVVSYFANNGYKMPAMMNPAEYMLDLVNSDFTDVAKVNKILDDWAKYESTLGTTDMTDCATSISAREGFGTGFCSQLGTMCHMLSRHGVLTMRDPMPPCPMLYMGRMIGFLFTCIFFAVVYIDARDRVQDQVLYRFFLIVWYVGVPMNLSLLVTYSYNEEYFAIWKEVMNGMVNPAAYVVSKSIIELPMMFVLSFFALSVGLYGMADFDPDYFFTMIFVHAVALWSFECMGQLFAVQFDNPLLGMLQMQNMWFSAFLFSEFFLPQDNVIWPFRYSTTFCL
jgi:ABC-type multidrug transport system ATPase subunit